jgi:hypothetical protein
MKRDMTAQTDQYRFPADYSTTIGPFGDQASEARSAKNIIISLDPGRFLNRLSSSLVLISPHGVGGRLD